MTDKYLAEPDLGFVKEVVRLGGDSVKKCFQCATCSVACAIAPDNKPFPRKEMIAASWGLKDKLVNNADIWLCHECGDCSTMCPRDAKPGDVLSAVRSIAIAEYGTPKSLPFLSSLGKAVNDKTKLPWLLIIPAIWLGLMAIITNLFRGPLTEALGHHWTHGVPADAIAHTNFISTWLVDITFVPLSGLVALMFGLGLIRFVKDIHENAVLEGKTANKDFNLTGFLSTFVGVLLTILKHNKFDQCTENKERSTAHMMVLYGFIGCAVVTGFAVILLYLFGAPGPYSQLTPLKWLANISGVAIIIGSGLLIKNRLDKKDQPSSYKDWYLLGIVFGVGLTGLLCEMLRLGELKMLSYLIYYLHLILVFNLFAYLPFSKMAHFIYRTVALMYAEYAGRK
jgi:quinone-modifying oxidoreductase subunit QmoC